MANVLLIEPDKVLGKIYKTALEKAGHRVELVNSAQAGISQADKSSPDLVILEIQLVEHSGIEFLYEFRSYADWQNIPVIIQSQVPPSEFNDSWQLLKDHLNLAVYLYKPVTHLKDLLKGVQQLTQETAPR